MFKYVHTSLLIFEFVEHIYIMLFFFFFLAQIVLLSPVHKSKILILAYLLSFSNKQTKTVLIWLRSLSINSIISKTQPSSWKLKNLKVVLFLHCFTINQYLQHHAASAMFVSCINISWFESLTLTLRMCFLNTFFLRSCPADG